MSIDPDKEKAAERIMKAAGVIPEDYQGKLDPLPGNKSGFRLIGFMLGRCGFEVRVAHWKEPYWHHIDGSGSEDLKRVDWFALHSSFRALGGSVHALNIGPLLMRVAVVARK
jgi:hypothetical protein